MALSRDKRWRHDEIKGGNHNFIIAFMLVQKLLKIDFCLIAQLPSTNPCTKPMGFFRQEEEEKKNQNKNNSFSASLKRAEKPKKNQNKNNSFSALLKRAEKPKIRTRTIAFPLRWSVRKSQLEILCLFAKQNRTYGFSAFTSKTYCILVQIYS